MKIVNTILKRIFDLFFSLLGIIIFLPIIVFFAILIYMFMSDGPIFYIQKRVGQYGELFSMIKFRTMLVNSDQSSVSVAGQSRITKLGAFLRKYKIDELPSLINVFIGNMSFVGPRPDVPGYADQLIGEDRKILNLKPGITGPATLKYSNEEELLSKVENPIEYSDNIIYPDKVKINLNYYYNNNIIIDLILIIKTVFRIKHEE